MNEYLEFMVETLVPAGNAVLRQTYEDYCAGKDIDVQTKDDNSPASAADREAEKILRELISANYPDHGIFGEEYGGEGLGRDYVWILDPLDGTREFLAKKPGKFGLLIGLFEKGRPLAGVISDPVSQKLWSGMIGEPPVSAPKMLSLEETVLCCTNPKIMFDNTPYEAGFNALSDKVKSMRTELNCMGFTALVAGEETLVVESDLGLHDIAALIPVLDQAGCVVTDLEGRPYRDMMFDLERASTEKFGLIAASCGARAAEVLTCFNGEKV